MNDITDTGLNPSSLDIVQGFAATRSTSKDYSKFLKSYRSVNNSPFRISSDVTASLRILALAHLEVFPASMNEAEEAKMWARSEDQTYFAGLIEKETKNLLVAARDHLGTHTAKVPNPSVTGPGGLFADAGVLSEASRHAFVSSASFNARQRVGAAGNAAQGKAQRFLASRIKVGNDIVDISESIASKGAVYNSMIELGFDPTAVSELAEILRGRMDGTVGDTTPGSGTKGLIWPTDEGDIVITPVHSYAMHVELAARIKARHDGNRSIDHTHIVVGGTKPQNAGLINSDMGGWHRMLISKPPEVSSIEERTALRVAKSGTIKLSTLNSNSDLVTDFRALLDARWINNDQARKSLDKAIASMIRISIIPLLSVQELGQETLSSEAFQTLSTAVHELFKIGFERMSRQTEILDMISKHIITETDLGSDVDDALRRRFVTVAVPILEKAFKGY